MVGQENILLVDRVTDTHRTEADVIIDIVKQKLIKAREVPDEYHEKVLNGYIEKYQDKIRGYIEFWLTKDPKNIDVLKEAVAQQEADMDPLDVIRMDIEHIVGEFMFDENTEITRKNIETTLSTYLLVKAEAGVLFDYAVKCNDDNNPEEVVRQHILHAEVAVKINEEDEFTFIPIIMKPADE